MLTKIALRNFKRFEHVEVELGDSVVLVGPNNSGKTSVLQALALWEAGLRRWHERRGSKPMPERRPGVTINRRDLVALPVPTAKALWRDLHVRDIAQGDGGQRTSNILIEITVSGADASEWECGLEFDYANEESFYCRPLHVPENRGGGRMSVPEEATRVRIAFLPPMSGLAAREQRQVAGTVASLVGEGRTAEVLRNLCYEVSQREDAWETVSVSLYRLFGVHIDPPEYLVESGEIVMTYRDRHGVRLDLSAAGRGLHQTLLLLAYLHANPGSVLLLDEPDAHLEILRQRQIYELLTSVARANRSQVLVATHSEVLLNEAADRDIVVAFVGRPHRIDDRGSQVGKALREIGFEHYYQAQIKGWVLYLEGATDLAILRRLAAALGHPAAELLEDPFVHYVGNQPPIAEHHFFGLREAKPDLVGIAIYDRLDRPPREDGGLVQATWGRREIENYICSPLVLLAWAEAEGRQLSPGPLFEQEEIRKRREVMQQSIEELVPRIAQNDPRDTWWSTVKASDEFLDRLFERYYDRLRLPNLMRKTDYHQLAQFARPGDLDDEIRAKLDQIVEIARQARPEG